MTDEEAGDLKAEVGLLRDEVRAAHVLMAMQTAAILELHERVSVQGKLLTLWSARLREERGE